MSKYLRTALVNVRIESRQRVPIGLLTLAACIKDKCTTTVFDPDPEEKQLNELVEWAPDLIGIGFMTQTKFRAKEIYAILKERLPDATFILGGVGPTVERDSVFEEFKPDALVIGEGEKTLEAIVEGVPLADIPGVYLPGQPFRPAEVYANLDEIPLPAFDCMPEFEKYLCPPGGIRGQWFDLGTPMIMTGRGCPYRCTFCSSRLMFSRKVRRRSVDNVIKEIRLYHDRYGVNAVYFFDDTFNAPPAWAFEFCEKIQQEPYRLTWGCQARVNLLTEELGRAMKQAGCVQMDIGVESGSPRVLKAIEKDETVEQITAAFDICHKVGIAPMGTFLVGCPEETWEDVVLTRKLLKRINPAFSEFFFLIPYPGSPLYEQAEKNGWLVDRSYEGRGMVDRPVMEINFTLEEQKQIRRDYFKMTAYRNIRGYLQPRVLIRLLRNLRFSMIRAAVVSFAKTRNIRDAMQALAHALRHHHAQAAKADRK